MYFLESGLRMLVFLLKKTNKLRLVSCASYYQLLIIPSRPIAFKRRTLSYWLATIMALTGVDCLLAPDDLIVILALIIYNYKID